MKKEKDDNQDFIDDFAEWQDNQYNPGYYLGGKIPRNLLYPGKPKGIGILLIIISLMTSIPFILGVLPFFQDIRSHSPMEYLLTFMQILIFGGFSLVLFIGGIRKIISRS